jgi:WD40-like Beta Propeller Repeat
VPLPPTKHSECRTLGNFSIPHPYVGLKSAQRSTHDLAQQERQNRRAFLPHTRVINLGKPGFYYRPTWSPDSKKIAYADKFLNFWYVDLEHPTPVKIDSGQYEGFGNELSESWSPDSRWITYAKTLPNQLHAIFVYSLASGKSVQVTDGMSDCSDPRFDKSGKYLYFMASTNTGLTHRAPICPVNSVP